VFFELNATSRAAGTAPAALFVIFPKNILTNHTKSATIKVDKIPVKPGDFMCKRENRSVQALSPKGVFL
jgi:hypothetical protein